MARRIVPVKTARNWPIGGASVLPQARSRIFVLVNGRKPTALAVRISVRGSIAEKNKVFFADGGRLVTRWPDKTAEKLHVLADIIALCDLADYRQRTSHRKGPQEPES